jgi:thiosulfate dehydrogenase
MLREESREMRDILAYIETLRLRERPPEHTPVRLVGRAQEGAAVYVQQCARCHGARGEGLPGALPTAAPAVWGADSYSIGAGMSRQYMLATFVRHNMPFDKLTVLSDQEAADAAAYVLTQPRQDFPGKEKDWPKGDAPPDVAYATNAARTKGQPMPPARPVLSRRVQPDSLVRRP